MNFCTYLLSFDFVLAKGSGDGIDLSQGQLVKEIVKLVECIVLMALLVQYSYAVQNFHDLNKEVRLDIFKKSFAPSLVHPK